jgi:amino acid adenylation domain-containing protein
MLHQEQFQHLSYTSSLSEEELQTVLVELNLDETDYSKNKNIHQLWEERVAAAPESIAVIWDDRQISYRELNERVNRLANYLRDLGIKPETIVSVYLEKSISRIVVLLAILKAGGAYLPIDPAYPQARVQHIIEDSQTRTIVTQKSLKGQLKTKARIIDLDLDAAEINRRSSDNPENASMGNHLAYVIYTSGSTGRPKGVEVEHKDISYHSQTIVEHYQITERDRILQFASVGFDVSLEQILPTLIAGATLVLDETKHLTGKEFHQKIVRLRLTAINLPPAYWSQWVQAVASKTSPSVAEIEHLRLVVCGGEAMPIDSLKLWQQSPLRDICLLNAYGPTETTITATTFKVNKDEEYDRVPIGRPLANRQVHILNKKQQMTPVGMQGELYLGGAGVARGYLNRIGLTRDKFIDSPFGEGRLYRTGDLVRYLPDGNIEFIGRADSQVKIRGFRVELGEIEIVLSHHHDVREAIVILREDNPNQKKLVAYVVPAEGSPYSSATKNENIVFSGKLRSFLAQRLPDYMIPALFVVLDRFPLTPNGKVDRRALPDPEIILNSNNTIAPRTPQEEILANIWQEVLKIETVGIEDNFLELGGHSLLATQIISRIREAFATEISPSAIFECPTIAELATKLTSGKTNSNKASHQLSILPTIEVRDKTENSNIPLSFAQERLWFLCQLEGNASAYNIANALYLQGKLDLAALERSLSVMVARHESLRTNFIECDGRPQQIIVAERSIDLESIDLRELAGVELERQIEASIEEVSRYRFDLATESLLKVRLLLVEPESYILLITIHHIISDGWSMGVFLEELAALYRDSSRGITPSLPPLTIQYADFAIWQKQHFSPEFLAPQLEYWKERLAELPPLLELPTDRARPAMQTFVGKCLAFELSPELTQQLQRFGQKSGATPYMTLLATLAILLSRYSQQTDIAIGSAIANRNRKEIESLIGFFVNTVVLRVDLADNPDFNELLARVRQTALSAYCHQDVPFEKLVEELQPERSPSYHPLFQVMFVWQNTPTTAWEIAGVEVVGQQIDTGGAKFDLTLSLEEKQGKIQGYWEYSTDLFDRDTILGMMGHFQNLLSAIVATPYKKVEELPLLSPSERKQLLFDWNQTTTPYPTDKCVQQIFEAVVKENPEAIALVWRDKQLTYGQLNENANKLAHYLRSLGIRSDVVVGMCLERSIEAIVGMLAILKAGGAYLPIDPTHPQDRINFMLRDAGVSIVLSQRSLLSVLPTEKINIIRLDADWHSIKLENGDDLECTSNPDGLAYVMYTSGSTGTPKGVCIPHRGVVRLVKETDYASFTANEVFLQLAPLAFDASTFEIWGSLLNGAKLVLFPQDKPSLGELGEIIQQQRIDTLWLTTGLFHLIVDERWEDLQSLRQLLVGGDVMSVARARKAAENLPNCRFVHCYGPTENTTFSTYHSIDRADFPLSSVPIGRPIANTRLYILDRFLEPVPIGVRGEIYLGGAGLARGYLNRPDLTEAKFIPNPFGEGKLYRTGDFARYLRDSRVEFGGRIDDRAKIRGFYVELGEIETILTSHENIKKAVAIVREDIPDDKRLVAYLVPCESIASIAESPLAANRLRDFIGRKLPDYAVPDAFVILDEIPLTANGKVDRRALPAVSPSRLELEATVLPRNELEAKLVEIWEEVLGLRPIGIRDNFFNLGGHSMLAIELFARIEKTFKKTLPLADIFQSPTIERLAERLKASVKPNDWQFLVPIQPKGYKPPLFCMPTYRGNPVGLKLSTFLDADRPVYSFKQVGADGKQAPQTKMEDMAASYIREIRILQPEGPYYLMGISFGTRLALEVAQQLIRQGQEIALLALLDSTAGSYARNAGIVDRVKTKFDLKEANLHAFNSYISRYYPGKITLFRAEAEIFRRYYPDPYAGWGELALGGIEVHDLPGVHTTFFKHPHIQILGAKLKDCLERAAVAVPPNLSASLVATEFDPSNAAFHRTLARIQAKEGNIEKEIASLRKALEIDPIQPLWVYKNLGEALNDRGDVNAALAVYRQAIAANPKHPYCYCLLGKALLERGDISRAVLAFDKAVALEPNNPVAYIQLGAALERGGKFDRAKIAYQQVVELEPNNPYSYQLLGNMLAKQGNLQEAIACFESAVNLEPNNPDASMRLGNAFNQDKQFDRAIVAFERAILLRPKNNQIAANYQGLGQAFYQLGNFDRAILAFERAIDLKPENIELYKGLSNSWRNKGDLAAANIILRKALQLASNRDDIHQLLGEVYLQQDKIDLAVAHLQKSIELKPDKPLVCRILGDIYLDRLKNSNAAIVYFQKALELDPSNVEVEDKIAKIRSAS